MWEVLLEDVGAKGEREDSNAAKGAGREDWAGGA